MKALMKALVLSLGFLSVSAASAAEICEIHPLLRGTDGAAAQCTNLDDGRALNANADLPKVAVVKKLLEMGYVAKSDSMFIKQ
jgi:hypothetical protein